MEPKKEKVSQSADNAGKSRRAFLASVGGLGVAGPLFASALFEKAQEGGVITKETIIEAEKLAGLEFTDAERELLLEDIGELVKSYEEIRKLNIGNEIAPALDFNPVPAGSVLPEQPKPSGLPAESVDRPASEAELAFMPVTKLAQLMRERKITSTELTKIYLERLRKYNPALECVVNLTVERALEEAGLADREIAAGDYRGPLHGIPWGAKDLLAAKGYRTTWGAKPYEEQVIEADATVTARLSGAGAVLVAKLTLGALAWGDVWFGGMTRNPWNTEQGSSGSSAGPASATAAGLTGFAIGSETWGSIVSPCTRCGATGLRPTFGRVSRNGAMALSWTMDKLGPICRSVEDCALVLEAIYGPDGHDRTVIDHPFAWNRDLDVTKLRVGYLKSTFEGEQEDEEETSAKEVQAINLRTLEELEKIGIKLIPFELPDFPINALSFILNVEAAAAFDELTRSNRDDLLVRQVKDAWPNVFRQSRFVPAVEYVQANRARTILMTKMAEAMEKVDVYVCPPYGGNNLLLTNLTGHPCVVLPNGFRSNGTPASITFNGNLFGEAQLLAVAKAYQDATGYHLKRPPLFS
jgi:Asp-tRNA(Asn)/Glu-tRNA(Gln) amidotransferase A subunit family amidase